MMMATCVTFFSMIANECNNEASWYVYLIIRGCPGFDGVGYGRVAISAFNAT